MAIVVSCTVVVLSSYAIRAVQGRGAADENAGAISNT